MYPERTKTRFYLPDQTRTDANVTDYAASTTYIRIYYPADKHMKVINKFYDSQLVTDVTKHSWHSRIIFYQPLITLSYSFSILIIINERKMLSKIQNKYTFFFICLFCFISMRFEIYVLWRKWEIRKTSYLSFTHANGDCYCNYIKRIFFFLTVICDFQPMHTLKVMTERPLSISHINLIFCLTSSWCYFWYTFIEVNQKNVWSVYMPL